MNNWLVQCDSQDDGCDNVYPGDLKQCPKCGAATAIVAISVQIDPTIFIYDLETYPNIFTCAILHPNTNQKWLFEISDRRDDSKQLKSTLQWFIDNNSKMLGYNNNHFDYAFIHKIMTSPVTMSAQLLYQICMDIIKPSAIDRQNYPWGKHNIAEYKQLIPQIDLFKIRHYDNKSKHTSLKALEFAMRMDNIRDLPFPPGTILNDAQKDELIHYNWHDVYATTMFYVRTLAEIDFRKEMSQKYNEDFTNYNDVKMGSKIFQLKLENAGIQCYSNKQVRQTHRARVHLTNCIPDYINFEHPEFRRILDVFRSKVLIGDNVKALFTGLHCTISGIEYHFGAGGLHASTKGLFESNDEYIIEDIDVAGMYPSIIVANNYFPEHLGEKFSPIFKELIDERKRVGKKTPMGAALKLAANGTFGKLADKYSYLYDLETLLQVTVTGQLSLVMVVEQLIKIPNLKIIQVNTDGITYYVHKCYQEQIKTMITWWENITNLEMEFAHYDRMWIADVNNYIGEFPDGSLKRKGRYEYELEYHKDASALIIPMAVEAYMVHGQEIKDFIHNHKNKFDFMLRAKVPRSNQLIMRWLDFGYDEPLGNIVRYYVTKTGGFLIKIAPPRGTPGEYKRANSLTDSFYNQIKSQIGTGVWDERIHTKNKSVHGESVETGISANWYTSDCSDASAFDWNLINYEYYIKKAKELIIE